MLVTQDFEWVYVGRIVSYMQAKNSKQIRKKSILFFWSRYFQSSTLI
ncbi:hypothetical protein GAGA_2277 [Paraglaciecola agarilytica NO2]|uniref:Uncharacterized protein n=1 Tax=Paraglaciecola agarilytica NO2 TaxID=1125747 RepID=A0ABQ0I7T8_9ALTE|nr:hypothetical protein GAGA_2277 [Paraglaciecola agarilytica NO2]